MAWKHCLKCKSEEHRYHAVIKQKHIPVRSQKQMAASSLTLHDLADKILPSAIFQKICIKISKQDDRSKDCKVESPKSLKIILILEILQKNL